MDHRLVINNYWGDCMCADHPVHDRVVYLFISVPEVL